MLHELINRMIINFNTLIKFAHLRDIRHSLFCHTRKSSEDTKKMKKLIFVFLPTIFGKVDRFALLRDHHVNTRPPTTTHHRDIFTFCSPNVCQRCLNVFDFEGLGQIKRVCAHLLPNKGCCSKYAFVPLENIEYN